MRPCCGGCSLGDATNRGGGPRTRLPEWEAGTVVIPARRAEQIGRLTDEADRVIADLVERLRDLPDPVLTIPREGVVDGWPASWWRAIAARVIEDVDGLRVTFQEDARYPDNASPSPPARG